MNDTLYLGTRKGFFTLRLAPSGWAIETVSFLGVAVPMLLQDPRTGRLYAAVEHGHFGTKLHVSTDNGKNWEEIACPAYPPKPDDVPETINPMSQEPVPWSLKKIWALEPGGLDQPGRLWCGTIPGGLFVSNDDGATWELVRSLWDHPARAGWFGGGADWPGIHSICVDPRDSRHVIIGVSCAGVWETKDDGQTWNNIGEGLEADFMPPEQAGDPGIQDPHRIVSCPADPDTVWMQHHNGIFLSRDFGQHWKRLHEAQPSAFGFGVAVHPEKPDTAWFVPGVKDEMRVPVDGALCVMRTEDGGKSFQVLREGLPQEHAYHIVYRHALEVAGDGKTLAFGSTTGSVWTSNNGGESWTRLSADLPPVYCLRFAA
jgi:photosystem II stability/assembly factor-like uncharacterized protein